MSEYLILHAWPLVVLVTLTLLSFMGFWLYMQLESVAPESAFNQAYLLMVVILALTWIYAMVCL